MEKLFGTDGIRGIANHHPMTIEVAVGVGRTLARIYCSAETNQVIIGQDTRQSGDMLVSGVMAGVLSAGGDARPLGVIPTPGVAYLTRASSRAAAGVMISASHNPFEDNGIKIFKRDGFKLSDEEERRLESVMAQGETQSRTNPVNHPMGSTKPYPQGSADYVRCLRNCAENFRVLDGLKLILDCSHGATYQVAGELFASLGAEVDPRFVSPNGTNINAGCGSQHPKQLAAEVVHQKAHAGLAFDGDGDRLIAVDETGAILSGDQIILACALNLKSKGRLSANTVVTTVMSNLGLRRALRENQIDHCMADVGDRYVLEMMKKTGACLGGEDSGHMIFLHDHTTGDGLLSAVRLLEAMLARRSKLSQLRELMKVYPQVLINVPVKAKPPLEQFPKISQIVEQVESRLGDEGRVLLRYSGTSFKCRVMVEGPSRELTASLAETIAAAVKKELGGKG
ncbi:MAG: phosphoglucosamine mutase [Desulfobacterales bacterium]